MAPPLPTPGPGAYNNTVKEKVPGGSYFGTGHITVGLDQSDASFTLSQEKQSFIKYDANKNGMLDFQELSKLLRKGDPFVTDTEVQALFHALDTDGDGSIGYNELTEYLHPPGSTFEHSTWRKKLRNAFQLSLPGPADYVGNDKNLAGKRNAPRAVIPAQRRMTDYGINQFSPGPCAYTSTDTGSAFHKKTYSATFGSAPKIRDGRSESPGPGAYAQNFSALAHQKQGPRATIGAARRALCYDGSEEPSPGPATYATETKYKVKGGSYFGVPGRMNLPDLPYEKRAFASCDIDKDGNLNVDEVFTLLQKSDPSITAVEAKQIFDACDQNQDGVIDFEELRNYLHPSSGNEHTAQRKRFKDIFSAKSPGPLDYDTIAPRTKKVHGGTIGRARR
ncbi:Polcalcin Cup a 4 (Calcium-binding pollen allergen Cup a 4) (allergen Cup a 4) [Durusdinium trenchii]|uniref:Polcalcin Cup a 4 (Calcium-binding pollen allergen Cup a 4) (Allergen Cup a 4) n=1 Tax=Durusdinium trenchii TaxID=1381693 RepID=A0ABP0HPJ1_9DINO